MAENIKIFMHLDQSNKNIPYDRLAEQFFPVFRHYIRRLCVNEYYNHESSAKPLLLLFCYVNSRK